MEEDSFLFFGPLSLLRAAGLLDVYLGNPSQKMVTTENLGWSKTTLIFRCIYGNVCAFQEILHYSIFSYIEKKYIFQTATLRGAS